MDTTPTRQRVPKEGAPDLEGGQAYNPKATKPKASIWRSSVTTSDAELTEFHQGLENAIMAAYPYRWQILCALVFLVLIIHIEEPELDRKPHLVIDERTYHNHHHHQ